MTNLYAPGFYICPCCECIAAIGVACEGCLMKEAHKEVYKRLIESNVNLSKTVRYELPPQILGN